jgi:hypothetical protein
VQDITPLTFMHDRVYVSGELWEYWRCAFLGSSVSQMFDFVLEDIDDERAKFTRSLAWRGPRSPAIACSFLFLVLCTYVSYCAVEYF